MESVTASVLHGRGSPTVTFQMCHACSVADFTGVARSA
jgi:hypothetical protein